MEVIRAKSAGFCFGVKRAVDTVYEQVEKQMGKQIYTYGPIIHNEEVVKDMEAHGVKVLHSEEELKGLKAELAALDRKIQLELAPPVPEKDISDKSQTENNTIKSGEFHSDTIVQQERKVRIGL